MATLDTLFAALVDEVHFEFVRAAGPGGQNVNKVATAVQLRLDVSRSRALPGEVKERLLKLAGSRATRAGIVVIEARRFRTQERNRQDALQRLRELLESARAKPRPRRKTAPSLAASEKRLQLKKQRSQIKKLRAPSRGEY